MKIKASITKQEAEIQATQKEIKEFFSGIVPDFVKEAGGILADTVRFWRWKNQVAIIKKAQKILEKNDLAKKQISLKVLVPLLEAGSLEEDESMQARWANLLANAISGSIEIRPNYVEILKELSPIEVLILDNLHEHASKETDYKKRLSLIFSKEKVCQWLSLSSEKFDLIIENLFRLNLCRMPRAPGVILGDSDSTVTKHTTEFFEFTAMGFNFVKACKEINNAKS